MKELNWIEKELCRRYLVGALLHVNKDLHTHGWRDRWIIDASNIFINRLNSLAVIYELEPGEDIGIDPVACRICRREVEHPTLDICLRCVMQKDEYRFHPLVDDLLDTQNSQDRDDKKDRR